MPIRAVIFDFDGVIVETEEPDYLAWRQIWALYGHELALEEWAACIGTSQGAHTFHPFQALVARTGLELSEPDLRARKRAIALELLDQAEVLDGVLGWLEEVERLGLGTAIASSSDRAWIDSHLARLGLGPRFATISCFDDCGVTKPDPSSYVMACLRLEVRPGDALAVEDSAHGVAAAKAAGLMCVAVPTVMTRHLNFEAADLVLESLASVSLFEVLARLESAGTPGD